MLDNVKIDFNQISFYLWLAVMAAIFLMFSVRFNDAYVYYGFITFVYGIVGHVLSKTFDNFEI